MDALMREEKRLKGDLDVLYSKMTEENERDIRKSCEEIYDRLKQIHVEMETKKSRVHTKGHTWRCRTSGYYNFETPCGTSCGCGCGQTVK